MNIGSWLTDRTFTRFDAYVCLPLNLLAITQLGWWSALVFVATAIVSSAMDQRFRDADLRESHLP